MKVFLLALISFAIGFGIGCNKSEVKPQPPVVVDPKPTPTPAPVATGKWCGVNRADFSPCNPYGPDVSKACSVGEQFTGCKSFDCRAVSDACPVALSLEDMKTYAQMRSSKLKVTMLDGSVKEIGVILPSPLPPVIPVIEAVEKADGFYLK